MLNENSFSPRRGIKALATHVFPPDFPALPAKERDEIRLGVWEATRAEEGQLRWALYSASYGRYAVAKDAVEKDSAAEAKYLRALCLLGLGKQNAGIDALVNLAEMEEVPAAILLHVTFDLIQLGCQQYAVRALGKLAASLAELPSPLVASAAQYLLVNGSAAEGLAFVRELQRRDPQNPRYEAAAGFALHQLERFLEATRSLKRAAQQNPESSEFWGMLGASAAAAGDFDTAESAFESALEIDPGYFDSNQNHRLAWEAAVQKRLAHSPMEWSIRLAMEPS